jgi:tetratricopeptide (TPR) repeat protein
VLSAKDNTRHRERLAELEARLADAAAEGIAPAAALPHYEKALRMARELSGQDPQNTTLRLAIAHLYRQLGTLHARQGQPDEARASYEQARSFARAVAAADAADATAQLAQTAAEVGLASLALALDAPTHAERARLAARLTALARIEPEGKDPLISELTQALQRSLKSNTTVLGGYDQ